MKMCLLSLLYSYSCSVFIFIYLLSIFFLCVFHLHMLFTGDVVRDDLISIKHIIKG